MADRKKETGKAADAVKATGAVKTADGSPLKSFRKAMSLSAVLTVVLCLLALILQSVRVDAVDDDYSKMYALVVTTGEESGEDIGMFIVTYKDKNDVTRKQYINPNDGDYTDTLKYAAGKGTQKSRMDGYVSWTGYQGKDWYSYGNAKALQKYSTDTYLSNFYYEVKSIVRVDAVTARGKANQAKWSCSDVRVYKVNKVNGLNMYGFVSNKFYVDFTGTMLARLEFNSVNHSRTLTTDSGSDKLFKFTADYEEGCRLETDSSKFDSGMKSYDGSKQEILYFHTEIADQYGAGVENFANYSGKSVNDWKPAEVLNYTVTYRDTFGAVRKVVLPAGTSSYIYAIENGAMNRNTKLADFMGQGEDFIFGGILPDFNELYGDSDISIEYGTDIIKNAEFDQKVSHSAFEDKISKEFDTLSVLNVTVYDGGTSHSKVYSLENNSLLRVTIPSNLKPISYHPADSARGIEFGNTANTVNATRSLRKANVKYTPNYGDEKRYLVVIGTHNSNEGATEAEIYMRLNYVSNMGPNKTTNEVSLKTQSQDFYGFWPDKQGNDAAYKVSVSKGMKLYCYVTVPDLSYFTGVTLTIDETMQDNWQLASLDIYEITDFGKISKRKAKWDSKTYGNTSVNMVYYREIDGKEVAIESDLTGLMEQENVMHRTDMNVLFTEQQPSKTVEFLTRTVTEEKKDDWVTDSYYNMSYEKAQQNILFGKKQNTYEVTVNVAADKEVSGPNGDTGSANYFYFQLVFANGSSAYVQANQQLASDSFRSGVSEVFTIATNRNYGDLIAINIIPDQSTTEASPYDKLMIDTIDVKSKTSTGLDFVWTFDVYDWIGIDYVEASQNDSTTTKLSRMAGEITKSYYNPRASRSASLLFTVGTGEWASGTQFYGKVKAKLNYKDKKGDDKIKEFDMVQSMYDFGFKPYKKVNDSVVSDTDLMFREGRYDRFLVSVADISSIKSLDIYVKAVEDFSSWNLNSMALQLVGEDNGRTLNEYDEYTLNGTIMDIATSTDSLPEKIDAVTNADVHKEIVFNADLNGLITDDDNSSPYSISRTPQSVNDSLNLFVFMDDTKNGDLSNVVMNSNIYYRVAGGTSMEIPQKLRYAKITQDGKTKQIYYYKGMGASNLDMLSSLYLTTGNVSDSPIVVDYAIIQRVRAGVIIDTFRVNFNVDVRYSSTEQIYGNMNRTSTEQQVVTLQLGPQTSTGVLTPEKYDLAVALQYTTTSDPIGNVYDSPYVYLTDSEIYRLRAGQTVEFTFNQQYVKEITGIRVAAVGGLMVNVTMGTVAEYSLSGGTEEQPLTKTLKKWSSIDQNVVVQNQAMPMTVTSTKTDSSETVIPVEFTFNTATKEEIANPGCADPIYMRVHYRDYQDQEQTYEILDLNSALTYSKNAEGLMETGNFEEGGTANVKFLLKGAKKIETIELHPYDTDEERVATWGLKDFSLIYGEDLTGVKKMSKRVNKLLTESEFKSFGTKTILIQLKAVSSENNTTTAETTSSEQAASIGLEGDGIVTFNIGVSGSTAGWNYKVVREVEGAETVKADEYFTKKDNSTATFAPPYNNTTAPVTYRVDIISDDDEETIATMRVIVAVAPPITIKATAETTPTYVEKRGIFMYNQDHIELSVQATSDDGLVAGLQMVAGDKVDFKVSMENSTRGWTYKAYRMKNGVAAEDVSDKFTKKNDTEGTFNVPGQEDAQNLETITYQIQIISVSNESVMARFDLSAKGILIHIATKASSLEDYLVAVRSDSDDAEPKSIGIDNGGSVLFEVVGEGASGWKYDVTKVVNGADVAKCNDCFILLDFLMDYGPESDTRGLDEETCYKIMHRAEDFENAALFTPPRNHTDSDITYRIEIISKDVESVKSVVNVVVPPGEAAHVIVQEKSLLSRLYITSPDSVDVPIGAGEGMEMYIGTKPSDVTFQYKVTEVSASGETDASNYIDMQHDDYWHAGIARFEVPDTAVAGTTYRLYFYVDGDESNAVQLNLVVQ